MKKRLVLGVALGFTHCMAVPVSEDYVSDVYYGQTRVIAVSASSSTSLSSVPVQVKFGSPMNASGITVNTGDTQCTGTIQVSTSAAFTTCLQFSSLSAENRDSIFTGILVADINPNSDYMVKILNTVTDFKGNPLGTETILTFRSGVPAGQEPSVTGVAFPKTVVAPINFQVNFTRPMTYSSILNAVTKDCNAADAVFILTNNTTGACANITAHTPTNTNAASYVLTYSGLTPASHTMVVRTGLIDQFGIPTIAQFSVTNTLTP